MTCLHLRGHIPATSGALPRDKMGSLSTDWISGRYAFAGLILKAAMVGPVQLKTTGLLGQHVKPEPTFTETRYMLQLLQCWKKPTCSGDHMHHKAWRDKGAGSSSVYNSFKFRRLLWHENLTFLTRRPRYRTEMSGEGILPRSICAKFKLGFRCWFSEWNVRGADDGQIVSVVWQPPFAH